MTFLPRNLKSVYEEFLDSFITQKVTIKLDEINLIQIAFGSYSLSSSLSVDKGRKL